MVRSAEGGGRSRGAGSGRLPAAERRAHLLAVAQEVFLENGLAGARTKQIAEAAGVAEAILYRHFESKEDLFEAAVLEPLEQFISDLVQDADQYASVDGRTRLELSHDAHSSALRALRQIVPLLGVALFSDHRSGRDFYQNRLWPLLEQFSGAIERSLQGWVHPKMDPQLLASTFLGTYVWLVLDAGFREVDLDEDAITKDVTAFFVRGMDAGRKGERRRR